MLIFLKGENVNQNNTWPQTPGVQEQLKVTTLWPYSCYEGRVHSKGEILNQSSGYFVTFIALMAIDTTIVLS